MTCTCIQSMLYAREILEPTPCACFKNMLYTHVFQNMRYLHVLKTYLMCMFLRNMHRMHVFQSNCMCMFQKNMRIVHVFQTNCMCMFQITYTYSMFFEHAHRVGFRLTKNACSQHQTTFMSGKHNISGQICTLRQEMKLMRPCMTLV